MEYAELTRWIAVWGAITGTVGSIAGVIGLWLRIKQHRMDKAMLKSDASFKFEGPEDYDVKHHITVRSIGRRSVTLDAVLFYMTPRTKWQKLFKVWQYRKGRWIYKQPLKTALKLSEGEKTEIKISLLKGIEIQGIRKVEVVDQAGRHWPVKWPTAPKLTKIATSEKLEFFEEKNTKRICSLQGHRLGERYFLQTKFNSIPSKNGLPTGRGFYFSNIENYRSKFNDVKDRQFAQFLAGEVNEIV